LGSNTNRSFEIKKLVRDYLKFENFHQHLVQILIISPLNNDASGDTISNNIFL
jgi:hypothetical protein